MPTISDAPKQIWVDLTQIIMGYEADPSKACADDTAYILAAEHERIVAEKDAEVAEMTRRRNEWRKKAEGYDAVRLALREKVGSPWPPHMSRILWAGIAADEKKRADDADAEIARLTEKADRTDFAEAQLQALLDMLPPPEPGMLLKRLKERAAQRALAEKE